MSTHELSCTTPAVTAVNEYLNAGVIQRHQQAGTEHLGRLRAEEAAFPTEDRLAHFIISVSHTFHIHSMRDWVTQLEAKHMSQRILKQMATNYVRKRHETDSTILLLQLE